MKLIVGIGNPEEKYEQTRHNIGFRFLDYVAEEIGANDFSLDKKLNALVSESKVEKFSVVLAKPMTYVNDSGKAVAGLAKKYKVKPRDIIIVQDDLDIPFGSFKNSFDRNSGGHKGIDSVIKNLKTKEFHRLRIGLAIPALTKARQQSEAKRDVFIRDFVLSPFSAEDEKILKQMFPKIYERLLLLLKQN
ncbi:MAG TPA: aminoacyl-tRNA hydrolase [Candidatus Paceibacterota bacterium]|nr:aminoacyl-tRNA hydrolase [Candidatus Paceibacterota bacterium]